MPREVINHLAMEYDDVGKGPVLLLLHGLGSTKLDWQEQVKYFSKEFRVISPDMRAHGGTQIPNHEYGVEYMAQDMKALLEHVSIEKASIIGFSMGGAVAYQMAYDYPEMVDKIVIVNSGPDFDKMDELGLDLLKTRTKFLKTQGLATLAKEIAFNMFPEESQLHWRKEFEERCAANDEEAYLQSFTTLMQWGMGDKLSEIHQPTLVIGSDMDYTPIEVKKEYAERMQNAKMVVIENSRHAVVMDQADKFNQVVHQFLIS